MGTCMRGNRFPLISCDLNGPHEVAKFMYVSPLLISHNVNLPKMGSSFPRRSESDKTFRWTSGVEMDMSGFTGLD